MLTSGVLSDHPSNNHLWEDSLQCCGERDQARVFEGFAKSQSSLKAQGFKSRSAYHGAVILLARVGEDCPFGLLRSPRRALPTETKVEGGACQSESETSVHFSNSGDFGSHAPRLVLEGGAQFPFWGWSFEVEAH